MCSEIRGRKEPVDEPTQFAAGEICSFPVSIERIGEHGRTTMLLITNTDSEESISVRIAGRRPSRRFPTETGAPTARSVPPHLLAGDVNGPGPS